MSDYITSPDAAEMAGIPAESIRELCRIGILRHRLIAGQFYPLREDVEHYVQLVAEAKKDEVQPVDYEQRTSQQRYLLLQFFWATAKRMFKNKEYPFSERESEIVYRVLIGQRLKQIGEEMDLSEGRVREIWHKALFRWSNYHTLLQQREDEIASLKGEINRLKAQLGKAVDQDLLATRLGDLDLSARSLNSLKEAEIETVADLVRLQKTDLLKYKNFSKRAIVELSEWLEQHGLSFGMNV